MSWPGAGTMSHPQWLQSHTGWKSLLWPPFFHPQEKYLCNWPFAQTAVGVRIIWMHTTSSKGSLGLSLTVTIRFNRASHAIEVILYIFLYIFISFWEGRMTPMGYGLRTWCGQNWEKRHLRFMHHLRSSWNHFQKQLKLQDLVTLSESKAVVRSLMSDSAGNCKCFSQWS